MTDREALKQALDFIERVNVDGWILADFESQMYATLAALRERLAEQPAQQEPVAYLCENAVGHKYFRWKKPSGMYKPIALYTLQPAQQEPNKDGSPCPEFWDWLPKAYNFDNNGAFTKYNMEVAFLAGKQASQPSQRILELEALLERQTARIVDLQTHIDNFDGEDR